MKEQNPAAELAKQVKNRVTVDVAAKYIGLAPHTLSKMRSEGRGPRYLKVGNRVFYRLSDLDAYLERSVVETADSRAA